MPAPIPSIRMRGIVKRYGPVTALDGVDLELVGAGVTGLVGENGAGKSTLMSILYGLTPATEGKVWLGDRQVGFASPREAIAAGIGMIPQRASLDPSLTIAENVALGSRPRGQLRYRRGTIEQSVQEMADRYRLAVDPCRLAAGLPADIRQRVAILRLLYRDVTTLILDEPTASLGDRDAAELLATLANLADHGHRCVISTHKLSEVIDLAANVVVLRKGRNVKTVQRPDIDEPTLISAMFGGQPVSEAARATELDRRREKRARSRPAGTVSEHFLRVDGLSVVPEAGRTSIGPLSFSVSRGEIIVIIGVEGNGESELMEALCGLRKLAGGSITVAGKRIDRMSPRERLVHHEVGVVTGDPAYWDLAMDLTVAENLALRRIFAGDSGFVSRGVLRRAKIQAYATDLIARYGIRPATAATLRVAALSGGHQQRVVLARELSAKPKVLFASYPTSGLDLEASRFVHDEVRALADAGSAVVYFTGDYDEIEALADRVAVLYRGKINFMATRADTSRDLIANALAGAKAS